MMQMIRSFLKSEAAGGVLLVFAAIIAMVIANSPASELYDGVLHAKVLSMSISHWVNDGLMAIFFLVIGLEVKRELLEGSLNSKEQAIFPAIAALGGMLAPALVYSLFNGADATASQGWAIPAATDIAFALGILALLGNRVPVSLKAFLLALAIIDDLGVIIIIALFYTSELSTMALAASVLLSVGLYLLHRYRVSALTPYLVLGAVLWFAVLQSGIHATLAGVVVGLSIPLHAGQGSPLKRLEHVLHPWTTFVILPIFAFVNAGISLAGVSMAGMTSTLPIGVALGLFVGKPLGIFTFSWLAVRLGIAKLPGGITTRHIFAISVLCGIGFTMSIFISSLAFGQAHLVMDSYARLGILMGSTCAALVGYTILSMTLPKNAENIESLAVEKIDVNT